MASDHFLRDTDDYFNWLFYQAQLRTNPLWGGWSWDTIGYMVILHLSGLSGLILSAQLDKGKAKWILLGINYLFATYYHIYIFLH